MEKYILGEIFCSSGATLYNNPSDQTVTCDQYHLFKYRLNSTYFERKFIITFLGHRSSGGYDHHNSVYGTYRRGGRGHHGGGGIGGGGGSGLNSSSHNEYNNFASSFEDEFDLKHFQQSLKSDLDSSPAAYQPPSQSQPRGLQHHAASR